jgi:chromosomal replication initiation ATPase DnaA
MSTTIFTFDHGQKKMNKAIGVEESYLDELATQCKDTITKVVFDENQKIRDEISPSQFVEIVANEFSYSQIVVMASYFLESKLDNIMEQMEQLNSKVKAMVLSGDDMPQELKDLLDKLTSEMDRQDGDGDDD